MYRSSCSRLLRQALACRRLPQQQRALASFAVVHHGDAYQKSMKGLHGQQLALALREGEGKDDPDFDPFLEEDLAEARKLAQAAGDDGSPEAGDEEGSSDDEEEDDEEGSDEKELEDDESRGSYFFDHKKYNNDGSLRRNKSEKYVLRAGAPAGGQVAVIQLAGTQFKVTTDDVLFVNKLLPVSKYAIGTTHTLDDILLVTNNATTLIGQPLVPGAEVDFMVEEVTKDAKVIVFRKKRKSRRKTGHRREVTMLRILDIRMPAPYDQIPYMERPDPAPLVEKTPRLLY